MDVKLTLREFRIRLKGWDKEVTVNLEEGRCRILTGINAGGKTLTLTALNRFCDLLKSPSPAKFRQFERFSRDAGLTKITVDYAYEFFREILGSQYQNLNLIPWLELAEADVNFDWFAYDERLGIEKPLQGHRGAIPSDNPVAGRQESERIAATSWGPEVYGQELHHDSIVGKIILTRGFDLNSKEDTTSLEERIEYSNPQLSREKTEEFLNEQEIDSGSGKPIWVQQDTVDFDVSEKSHGSFQHRITGPIIMSHSHINFPEMRSFGPSSSEYISDELHDAYVDNMGDYEGDEDRPLTMFWETQSATGWISELYRETGIKFDYDQYYGEHFAFENAMNHYTFEVLVPEWLPVDEAYELEKRRIADMQSTTREINDPGTKNHLLSEAYEEFRATMTKRFGPLGAANRVIKDLSSIIAGAYPNLEVNLRKYVYDGPGSTLSDREYLKSAEEYFHAYEIMSKVVGLDFPEWDIDSWRRSLPEMGPVSWANNKSWLDGPIEIRDLRAKLVEKISYFNANLSFWTPEILDDGPEFNQFERNLDSPIRRKEAGRWSSLFTENCPKVSLDSSENTNIDSHLNNKLRAFSRDFLFWDTMSEFDEIFRDLDNEYWSSGQMRLLSMMSRICDFNDQEGATILIDEPELSLHIDWQTKLVSKLTRALPECNFLIATHSPSIIEDHISKVVLVPPPEVGE